MPLPPARPTFNLFRNLTARLATPRSLQLTLTLRIAGLMTVGLSAVTAWTFWQTQNILIDSHKQFLEETAQRIEDDIVLYREMLPLTDSIQKALKNRAANNLWIGFKPMDGALIVKEPLDEQKPYLDAMAFEKLTGHLSTTSSTQIYQIQGRNFVTCAEPVLLRQMPVGTLYLVHDMSDDQGKVDQLTHSLIATNLTALVLLIALMAYEARRLLLPLRQVSQMTKALSIDDLGEKQIVVPHAPQEVQELVKTFNMLLYRLSAAWRQQHAVTEQQRQFVSNVSHELRTPLTIVRGYLDSVLRRGQNLTDTQQEALSIASTETDHTIRILKDLLDLARADDGYMTYQSELLILNDLVSDVAKLAGTLNARPIHLDAPELVPVYADAHRLKQVLINLVENAIKYSSDQSPITLQIEQQQQFALIHVCDRGSGIALNHQARIFERFYRIDEARSRKGGTGLGLALVKTFVEGMGGSIAVTSQVNEGSTFTVTLPSTPPGEGFPVLNSARSLR